MLAWYGVKAQGQTMMVSFHIANCATDGHKLDSLRSQKKQGMLLIGSHLANDLKSDSS